MHREPSGEDSARVRDAGVGPKLTKLGESDDVEAYLTTFERMMAAYGVNRPQCVYRLAPHLTGKAQQAYAAMPTEDASTYDEVKAAVLRRYDISTETYCQRFREARLKEGETHGDSPVRPCKQVDKGVHYCQGCGGDDREGDTMPATVQVWVHERKPLNSAEEGQLADDYAQARKVSG